MNKKEEFEYKKELAMELRSDYIFAPQHKYAVDSNPLAKYGYKKNELTGNWEKI